MTTVVEMIFVSALARLRRWPAKIGTAIKVAR